MIRTPAVAGLFYPDDPKTLERTIRALLAQAPRHDGPRPKAIIAPHAGYVYSGPIAATVYARLDKAVERVVLLGPAHRYPLRGIASHSAHFFETPLGRIPVEQGEVPPLDAAHAGEHSLEVHLPFLQVVCGKFTVVPLVVGEARPARVAAVLERLWGGPETVIVISSDLSHFHDYATAKRLDRATADAIVALRENDVGPENACGCRPIGGLLAVARRRGLTIEALDLRSSGDTAGDHDRVVGYGAFACVER